MKKWLIFLLILFFGMIIFGIFYFKSPSPQDCRKLGTLMEQDSCYMRNAEIQKSFKVCDNIQDASAKANCYRSVAFIAGDSSICTLINQWDDNSIVIKMDCYLSVAIKNKDSSICNEISSEAGVNYLGFRNSCINSVDTEQCNIVGLYVNCYPIN
jgi:hypothetical protein